MRRIHIKTNGTFEDGLQKYIGAYYSKIEKTPAVRHDKDRHIALIEEVNKQYLVWLSKTEWDDDINREHFKNQINFLTGVYDEKKKEEDLKRLKQEIAAGIKLILN